MTNNSEEAEVAEAKAAIAHTVRRHQDRLLLKFQCEIRKAFPFGPQATVTEKRVWEETVKNTVSELSDWMKTFPMMICILLLALPANADNLNQTVTILDKSGQPFAAVAPSQQAEAPKPIKVPKIRWAQRHPRVTFVARFIRKWGPPAMSMLGDGAQMLTAAK